MPFALKMNDDRWLAGELIHATRPFHNPHCGSIGFSPRPQCTPTKNFPRGDS